MNGRVNNAVILELSSLDLTEMADLDPAWHRWTRGAEKNYQHKKANVRFNQLAAQPRADGLSETDARKNASTILEDVYCRLFGNELFEASQDFRRLHWLGRCGSR